MRKLLVFALMLCMVGAASAADLGNQLPRNDPFDA